MQCFHCDCNSLPRQQRPQQTTKKTTPLVTHSPLKVHYQTQMLNEPILFKDSFQPDLFTGIYFIQGHLSSINISSMAFPKTILTQQPAGLYIYLWKKIKKVGRWHCKKITASHVCLNPKHFFLHLKHTSLWSKNHPHQKAMGKQINYPGWQFGTVCRLSAQNPSTVQVNAEQTEKLCRFQCGFSSGEFEISNIFQPHAPGCPV